NPNCDEADETWEDIGYNYLIDPYGNIYEGREGGNGSIGAHSPPNSHKIGIAIIGNYSNSLPSIHAMAALERLLVIVSVINDIDLNWQSSVFGHRDFNSTACPGQHFYNEINALIARANSRKPTYQTQLSILNQA